MTDPTDRWIAEVREMHKNHRHEEADYCVACRLLGLLDAQRAKLGEARVAGFRVARNLEAGANKEVRAELHAQRAVVEAARRDREVRHKNDPAPSGSGCTHPICVALAALDAARGGEDTSE